MNNHGRVNVFILAVCVISVLSVLLCMNTQGKITKSERRTPPIAPRMIAK